MRKTLSGSLRERVNQSFCVFQPSIQTSPALLRSSPARSERQSENRIDCPSLLQTFGNVKRAPKTNRRQRCPRAVMTPRTGAFCDTSSEGDLSTVR